MQFITHSQSTVNNSKTVAVNRSAWGKLRRLVGETESGNIISCDRANGVHICFTEHQMHLLLLFFFFFTHFTAGEEKCKLMQI